MTPNISFNDFLLFEKQVFGDEFPIAKYDPALIRYGEYRFVLDELHLQPGMALLDLGCEQNIFMQYLAYRGVRILGVDINPKLQHPIDDLKRKVEKSTKVALDIRFKTDDATKLSLESESVDAVIAISSIEHMFSDKGHGDQLAVASIAHVLKTGGVAVITVPMSNGTPFHESPRGDARFAGPYRLYTPDKLAERYLSNSELEVVSLKYLANSTPDVRFSQMHFHQFWLQTLSANDRTKWNWVQPILASVFNPSVPAQEGEQRLEALNTALICLRKK
jgi:SAM-dependent methyltransferase